MYLEQLVPDRGNPSESLTDWPPLPILNFDKSVSYGNQLNLITLSLYARVQTVDGKVATDAKIALRS